MTGKFIQIRTLRLKKNTFCNIWVDGDDGILYDKKVSLDKLLEMHLNDVVSLDGAVKKEIFRSKLSKYEHNKKEPLKAFLDTLYKDFDKEYLIEETGSKNYQDHIQYLIDKKEINLPKFDQNYEPSIDPLGSDTPLRPPSPTRNKDQSQINLNIENFINKYKFIYKDQLYLSLKDATPEKKMEFLKKYDKFLKFKPRVSLEDSENKEFLIKLFKDIFSCFKAENPILDFSIDEIYKSTKNSIYENKNKIEKNIIDLFFKNDKFESLLYFNEIEFLNKKIEEEIKKPKQNIKLQKQDTPNRKPVFNDELKPGKRTKNPKRWKSNKKTTSSAEKEYSRNKKNQKQGDEAEKMVFDALKNYGIKEINKYFKPKKYKKENVKWVSGAAKRAGYPERDCNDACGYDIKIKTKDKILYIEVKSKSESGTNFLLSNNEYDFAINNADEYVIIFIDNMKNTPTIHSPIWKFWDNKNFDIITTEYEVMYNPDKE